MNGKNFFRKHWKTIGLWILSNIAVVFLTEIVSSIFFNQDLRVSYVISEMTLKQEPLSEENETIKIPFIAHEDGKGKLLKGFWGEMNISLKKKSGDISEAYVYTSPFDEKESEFDINNLKKISFTREPLLSLGQYEFTQEVIYMSESEDFAKEIFIVTKDRNDNIDISVLFAKIESKVNIDMRDGFQVTADLNELSDSGVKDYGVISTTDIISSESIVLEKGTHISIDSNKLLDKISLIKTKYEGFPKS